MSTFTGMKTNPIDPEMERVFRVQDYTKSLVELNSQAYRISGHAGMDEAEKKKELEKIQGKVKALTEYWQTRLRGEE